MQKIKPLTMMVALLVVAMSVIACANPTPVDPSASSPKILKVGVLGPFSGPSQPTGTQLRQAVELAFEGINYNVGDYQIELVWIDTQSNPEVAAKAYREAIKQGKIDVSILNWHSSVSVVLMDVAAELKMPHFFSLGQTEVVNQKYHSDPEKYSYWNFKIWPGATKLTTGYVAAIEEAIAHEIWTPQTKRVALVSEDTDWGRSFSNSIKTYLTETGWDVVEDHYVPIDNGEFRPLLNDYKAKDIDLLVACGSTAAFMHPFVQQRAEVGLNALTITNALRHNWYEATGEASNYLLDQRPQWSPGVGEAFATAFEERWQSVPENTSAGLPYDSAMFFILLLQETYQTHGELSADLLHQFGQDKVKTGQLSYKNGVLMPEYKFTLDSVPDVLMGEDYFFFPVVQYLEGDDYVIWPGAWKEFDLKLN